MTVSLQDLDAHEQPSDYLRTEFMRFKKSDQSELLKSRHIDDPTLPPEISGFKTTGSISKRQMEEAFGHLGITDVTIDGDAPILHHPLLPDLLIIPDLLPPPVQVRLVDLMVHRDLSNPKHSSNMHLHYTLPYPPGSSVPKRSFFSLLPDSSSPTSTFQPLDPSVHKPLTPRQVFNRRLSWLTLGGQYDWAERIYPAGKPPPFPADEAAFLSALFPDTVAQAAIVNFYTPGDTMMMHRDVSERVNRGLVSLSIGCDGLFMIAPSNCSPAPGENEATSSSKDYLLLRLRSGDAVYMTGESRHAFHGVPKILKGTCPEHLQGWPATEDGSFEQWRGWMANKRINLNVRQMEDP